MQIGGGGGRGFFVYFSIFFFTQVHKDITSQINLYCYRINTVLCLIKDIGVGTGGGGLGIS